MILTIKLTKKEGIGLDDKADNFFSLIETRVTRTFAGTCSNSRQGKIIYRPVTNKKNLTRVFEVDANPEDRVLLKTILSEYVKRIMCWEANHKLEKSLAESLLPAIKRPGSKKVLCDFINRQERLLKKMIEAYKTRYKIDIRYSLDEEQSPSPSGAATRTDSEGKSPEGSGLGEERKLDLPEHSDNQSSDNPLPEPPAENPEPVSFRGRFLRLGCQPNVPSEIYTHNGMENFFLDEETQKEVESNLKSYVRTWVDFVICPGRPKTVAFKKVQPTK